MILKRKSELECKNLFIKSYPHISWEQIYRQTTDAFTDDGCTHYIDRVNNQIYSWNYCGKKWTQPPEQSKDCLLKLFKPAPNSYVK